MWNACSKFMWHIERNWNGVFHVIYPINPSFGILLIFDFSKKKFSDVTVSCSRRFFSIPSVFLFLVLYLHMYVGVQFLITTFTLYFYYNSYFSLQILRILFWLSFHASSSFSLLFLSLFIFFSRLLCILLYCDLSHWFLLLSISYLL